MKEMLNMMKTSRLSVRKKKITQQGGMLKSNSAGAAIIVIIIGMTITAILGAGILYLFSSSSFTEVFISNREKAYYLAQAGRQYATMIINNKNNAGHPEEIDALLDGKTFTLDGNEFYLRTKTTIDNTKVESTGIVNKGSASETKQKIFFIIPGIKFGQGVNACYDYQGIYGADRGGTITISSTGYIDSYNSELGAYEDQPRGSSATVKTNGGGTLSGPGTFISLSSAGSKKGMIYGDAICGAGGNPDIAISAGVDQITGTRTAAIYDVLPSAVLPNELDPSDPGCQCTDPTGITCNWSACGPEGNYIGVWDIKNTFKTLTGQSPQIGSSIDNPILGETDPEKPAIIYTTNKITLYTGGKLYFKGKVVLIVYKNIGKDTGEISMSNASEIIILPGGTLDLYVESDASFASGAIVNQPPSKATVMKVVGIRTATISFSSTNIYSLMYGPGATCNIASTGILYGSITARKISVIGAVHLDAAASSSKKEGIVY